MLEIHKSRSDLNLEKRWYNIIQSMVPFTLAKWLQNRLLELVQSEHLWIIQCTGSVSISKDSIAVLLQIGMMKCVEENVLSS